MKENFVFILGCILVAGLTATAFTVERATNTTSAFAPDTLLTGTTLPQAAPSTLEQTTASQAQTTTTPVTTPSTSPPQSIHAIQGGEGFDD